MFSVNPETGAYTLVQSERLDRLDPKAFFALVEKFVNTLATWKGVSAAVQGENQARGQVAISIDAATFVDGAFMV